MILVALALAWVCGFVAVGAFAAPWWSAALGPTLALVPVLSGAGVSWRRALLGFAAVTLSLAGGWRAADFLADPPPSLSRFVDTEVALVGRVDGEATRGLATVRYPVAVTSLDTDGARIDVEGRVLITAGEYDAVGVGAIVQIRGRLERPPSIEGFDYAAYLARRGVVGTMFRPRVEVLASPAAGDWRAQLARARGALDRAVARSLPEPEAALASGILLGKDDALADEVTDSFRRAGLAHIVAVSGSNIVVITALTFAGFSPLLGRRRAMLVAAGALVGYAGLAGAEWTVVRAALMSGVYLLGEALGRPRSSLDALGLVVIVITGFRPSAAFEVGFQLSAAATAGLVAFGPWIRWAITRAMGGHGRAVVPGLVVEVTALSLSATLATLPISWAVFGQVSLVGPLANLAIEPIFPFAFASAGATAVAGQAWEPAGGLAGLVAYYPVHGMVIVAENLAHWPGAAVVPGRVDSRFAVVAMALLACGAWPCYRHLPPDSPPPSPSVAATVARLCSRVGLGGIGAVAVVATSLLPLRGPGALQLVVLDVGQGDALLVVTPHGRQVLVDGGPSGLRLAQELGRVLPHWDRTLDAVILTHPQEDHVAGLPAILDRYRVGQALGSGATNTSAAARLFLQASDPISRTVGTGTSFALDEVTFDVIWPPEGSAAANLNDVSVVLRVSYRGQSVLLTGDLEGEALERVAAFTDVRADVLKVPHHGSSTTPNWFFTAVGPDLAVISVGRDNRYGHPAPSTLAALAGVETLRTDVDGRLTVTLDGRRVRATGAHGRSVTLPVPAGEKYGWSQQEDAHGDANRWPAPGPASAREVDAPRVGVRRRQLPGRIRKDPGALCRQRRGASAGLAARYVERLDHL